ncbi:hypothetical protein AX15_004611 [Amanita polypyramis BW_CC]|nr:hypothetical protein AX15_004611 [Amanita polypyramis BW_CC]
MPPPLPISWPPSLLYDHPLYRPRLMLATSLAPRWPTAPPLPASSLRTSPPSTPMDQTSPTPISRPLSAPTLAGSLSALSPRQSLSNLLAAPLGCRPLLFVKSATCEPPPLPVPSSRVPSTSSVPSVALRLGSLIDPLHSVPPAASGVTLPTSAGPGSPALEDPSHARVACLNCSGPHPATSWGCPFFLHRFNAPALAELQKSRLHRIKEAQASKAASKPAKAPKGKGKA